MLDSFKSDFFYGWRILRRNPSFAFVATASLALGIGANTLIFSIINSTLLKPMGYGDASRLAVIWTAPTDHRDQIGTSSVSTYFALRDQSRSFESLGAFNGGGCGVRTLGADRDGGAAERIFGQCFSPSLFDALGVKPAIGRTFTDAEDQVGNVASVVLLSDSFWKSRFGADRGIIGKTITINRVPATVIGVLPADFELFKDPNAPSTRAADLDFIVPLELAPTQVQSRVGGLTIVGRLKPGVSAVQAQAEIDTIAAQLARDDPERHDGLIARVESLQRAAYRDYRSPLLILEGAVGFVLLISCANVAGLLVARTANRRSEVALRLALGAARWRLVRQFITENLPIGFIGGAVGVVLSMAGLRVFVAAAPSDFPRLGQVSVDGRVLAFTAVAVVLTSILSAIAPAVQASNVKVGDPLREVTRSSTGGLHRQRLRSLLVMGQIALAVVLLVGAGLMVNSFVRVLKNNLGADPSNLLTFDFRLTQNETVTPAGRYRGLGLWNISPVPAERVERVLDRLHSVPGVQAVGAVNLSPFGGQTMSMPFAVEGHPASPVGGQQTATYFAVTRDFFGALRIPLIRGRDFTDRDGRDSLHVMIINQTMARQFFPNEDPLGKHVTMDFVPNERPWEIVGVVGDMATTPLQRQQAAAIYVPHIQQPSSFTGPLWYTRSGMYFVLRTSVAPMTLLPAVKSAVAEVDRNTPVADVRTAEQTIANQVRNLRLYMLLLGVFGSIAAILAAIGIYGVMAYSVAERTREIGIRIALGGRVHDVLMMVCRHAAWVVGIGLIAGLAGSLVLSGLIRSALFGIGATDPATYLAVSFVLLVIAVIACLIPAHRAASIDPTLALKHE
jgi:putative ABC transport system permease protein